FPTADIQLRWNACQRLAQNAHLASFGKMNQLLTQMNYRDVESSGNRATRAFHCLIKTAQQDVRVDQEIDGVDTPRIKLHRAPKVVLCFRPAALPAIDVAGESEKGGAVWQAGSGERELLIGTVVVALTAKIKVGHREMSFSGIGREA